MSKVRELTIDGLTYRVSNRQGILDPGKFEAERPHTVRDYDADRHDEAFGTGDEAYWRVKHRAYYEDSRGFVNEVTMASYTIARDEYAKAIGLDDLEELFAP